jgi:Ca2+-binding RTX toxin-like protein
MHRHPHPFRSKVAVTAAGLLAATVLSASGAGAIVRAPSVQDLSTDPGRGAEPSTCRGVEADVVVGPGEEYVATNGDDVIVVVGPDAVVWAQYGDDLICVHQSADGHYGGSTINGSYGDDTIITYGGNNTINAYGGDADADFVYLNGDHEYVDTGAGNDVVYAGGALVADVHAGDGNDYVVGSPGGDLIEAGAGNDTVLGAGGADEIDGDLGNDKLSGNAGLDAIDGGDHYDECLDHQGAQGANFSNCENVFVSLAPPAVLVFG